MKRLAVWTMVATAVLLVAGATQSFAQSTFKIPYAFKVGSASFPKGEYTVAPKDASHLTLKNTASGKETDITFSGRLPQPRPSVADPQIVFDVVGNFAPSYTDYVTDYVVSEVWLGGDGFEIHTMKGAHKTETVKGEKSK